MTSKGPLNFNRCDGQAVNRDEMDSSKSAIEKDIASMEATNQRRIPLKIN